MRLWIKENCRSYSKWQHKISCNNSKWQPPISTQTLVHSVPFRYIDNPWVGPDCSIYTFVVLHTMSLLPSQPANRCPFIHLDREEQVKVKRLAQGHNAHAHTGFELTTLGSWVRSFTVELRVLCFFLESKWLNTFKKLFKIVFFFSNSNACNAFLSSRYLLHALLTYLLACLYLSISNTVFYVNRQVFL